MLLLAEFFELQFRWTFCHANACTVIPAAALGTLEPDTFSFALFFSHKSLFRRADRLVPDKRPQTQDYEAWVLRLVS